MTHTAEVSSAALVSICESLLLCLADNGILTERDITGLLEDAAAAHANAANHGSDPEFNRRVSALITSMIKHDYSSYID